jgi:hypothetical protein
MSFLSELAAKVPLSVQENAPKYLFGAGMIGFGATVVTACRATMKLETTIEKGERDLAVHKAITDEKYTDRDRGRDIARIYVRTALDVGKLYAPSIVIGAASIACLTKSHSILQERNAALAMAYAAVDTAFREYRARVTDRYGEEIDREMRYGVEKVEIINPETGRKNTVKRASPGVPSQYAKFFDEYSKSWGKDPEVNFYFIRVQQQYWNDVLRSRGHVFLNEVYRSLGIPHTQAGAIVGWRMTPDMVGDNYIDFGLFRDDQSVRDFMNGREGSILLDFNVDGVIFDKIRDDRPPFPISWQDGELDG